VSAAALDELAALRGEIEEIAWRAGQIPAEPTGDPYPTNYFFGIASSAEDKIAAISESVTETLARLGPVAHFETTVDGFTAKTVIHYSGLAASVCSIGAPPGLAVAHLESLQRVYSFRAGVTEVVAAVGNAVVAISIAMANPATAWHGVKAAEALKTAVDRLAPLVAANARWTSAPG
jgi:hypothetical protein